MLNRTLQLSLLLLIFNLSLSAQQAFHYQLSMENPGQHTFQVKLDYTAEAKDTVLFKIPDWTPGYYQLMDYASLVSDFSVKDAKGKNLAWKPSGKTGWAVATKGARKLSIQYHVKTTRKFVATSYLDEAHAYVIPGATFLYVPGKISSPVEITVHPANNWNRVATGLDSIPGRGFTYRASDFDVLYDSPLLIGNLEELPPFLVKGIPHRFIGYKLGSFDKKRLMSDIQKVVENASALMGDIPYKHYTFIAIGPGQGGIEHLNSTTISFSGDLLNSRGWEGMLNFITHEYFHHYNVKRIRPIELGPFDYDNGSKTNSLWVSEGLTVYYEPVVMRRSGLMTAERMIDFFQNLIAGVETKPGRLFQTLAESSAETWFDGPFGRTGDEVNKTISYYQKGPIVGLLFDFAIRHETQNKRSLDDVMRKLYNDFYIKKERGFTEAELKQTLETVAGKPLDELFSYIYTTKELDYPKYLGYAGLAIDTAGHEVKGGYFGADIKLKNDSVFVGNVDWKSPAWEAGLRSGVQIVGVEGHDAKQLKNVLNDQQPGAKLTLNIVNNGVSETKTLTLGSKKDKTFAISQLPNPDALQKRILESWSRGK